MKIRMLLVSGIVNRWGSGWATNLLFRMDHPSCSCGHRDRQKEQLKLACLCGYTNQRTPRAATIQKRAGEGVDIPWAGLCTPCQHFILIIASPQLCARWKRELSLTCLVTCLELYCELQALVPLCDGSLISGFYHRPQRWAPGHSFQWLHRGPMGTSHPAHPKLPYFIHLHMHIFSCSNISNQNIS